MRFNKLLFVFLLAAVYFTSSAVVQCAEAADGDDKLQEDLLAMIESSGLGSAQIGIFIEGTKSDKPLFRYNEEKRFVAASNMKLYTTAAALLSLGPDYNYETALVTDGTVEAGVLTGNLIILASGDPTISGYFHADNPLKIYQDWAQRLAAQGIKEVRGDIIIDNEGFQDGPFGDGWLIDDIEKCYSAPKNAFSFNNNCLAITVTPGKKTSDPAESKLEPETTFFKVINKVSTANSGMPEDIEAHYVKDTNTILLTGAIPAGHKERIKYIAINEPAEFGAFVFKETLATAGISVSGGIYCTGSGCIKRKTPEPLPTARLKTLALYESPKLSEILKVINKLSNNFYTEQLFLTIAEANQKETNTRGAFCAVTDILKRAGLDAKDLYMADGSGLSRYDLITPEETAQLLKIMARHPSFEVFYASLATAGSDGTLKNWPKGTPIKDNIRAKTGTMTHVRNLSGYITTAGGELLVFSLLCNNFDTSADTVNRLWYRILTRIAGLSRR